MPSPLQSLTAAELADRAEIDLGDARRLLSRVHRDGSLPEVAFSGVRRTSLQRVRAVGFVPRLRVVGCARSNVDPFRKCLLELPDGFRVETVSWPVKDPARVIVCVSSQVGCSLGCRFCATGTLGLRRSLQAWEIIEQVRAVRDELSPGQRVHGVVFQGMGEPLANVAEVIRATKILSEPYVPAVDRRRITISTAGIPAGILRMADEVPEVRLAISIGSARAERRGSLMPIDRRFSLADVVDASVEHARKTGRAPMFSYALIHAETDGVDDARALAKLAKDFEARSKKRPRISLIPFNPISGSLFEPPTLDAIVAFRTTMHREGVGTKLRYSGGDDVAAACGQLVASER